MFWRRWAAWAALFVEVHGGLTFVGSAGCDGDDGGCQEGLHENVIGAFQVLPSGESVAQPSLNVDVGDLPVWMALKGLSTPRCLFVTRPNLNDILALRIDLQGHMQQVGSTPSGGRNPVFASLTTDEEFLLVANYNGPDDGKHSNGSSVSSLHIGETCALSLVDTQAHAGSSVDPSRQNAAHPHSFVGGKNNFAFSCDLGMDTVFTYRVMPGGALQEVSRVSVSPGLGPRHVVEHPTLPFLFVVCEMGQVILSFQLSPDGSLHLQQTLSLLEDGTTGAGSKAAEIVMKVDGSALYVTNRGVQNTVTAFSIKGGTLRILQQVPAPAYPRGMTLLAGDTQLLVAGQSKSEIVSYRVSSDGSLEVAASSSKDVPAHPAAFLVMPTAWEDLNI